MADLICLPLAHLDVILGMNWLSTNHIFLNCKENMLVFGGNVIPNEPLKENAANDGMGDVQTYMVLFSMLLCHFGVNLLCYHAHLSNMFLFVLPTTCSHACICHHSCITFVSSSFSREAGRSASPS